MSIRSCVTKSIVTWNLSDTRLVRPLSSVVHIPSELGGIFSPKNLPLPSHQWLFVHPKHSELPLAVKAVIPADSAKGSGVTRSKIGKEKGKEEKKSKTPVKLSNAVTPDENATNPSILWMNFLLSIGCKDTIQASRDGPCELRDALIAIEKAAEEDLDGAFRLSEGLLSSMDRMFLQYESKMDQEAVSQLVRQYSWCPGVLGRRKFLSTPTALYRNDLSVTLSDVSVTMDFLDF